MTEQLERPRWDRKNEPLADYEKRREDYVAHYRRERSKPRIIERTETVREIVTEQDDSETRDRLERLEREAQENADTIAYLLSPSDIEDRIADLDEEDDERPPLDAEAEAALTTDDLLAESDEVASDVISKLSRDRRRRFTELLNVEMAELQLARGGPKEDRRREQKIERLLGIFARAGEM